jgi:hypothetical protein
MKRLYFENENSEICYLEEHFMDIMRCDGVYEMTVMTAIPDKTSGVFWCSMHCFCGDDSKDTCGKQCKQYAPRNGKNGCCKHYTTTVYLHGENVILKLNTTNK